MNKYLKWVWRVVSVLLVAFVMWQIFSFSHQKASVSSEQSGGVTESIMGAVSDTFDELPQKDKETVIDQLQHLIRKSAHFIIYFALGFLSCNMFYSFKMRMIKSGIIGLILSVGYAISDEIHQHFIPGRGCTFSDMALDSAAALAGIIVFAAVALFIMAVIRKINEKRTAS